MSKRKATDSVVDESKIEKKTSLEQVSGEETLDIIPVCIRFVII